LFAVEDHENCPGTGGSRVKLNPGPSFVLEAEADGFLLCTNQEVASEIAAWASGSELTYEEQLRDEVGGSVAGASGRDGATDGEGEFGGVIELVDCSTGAVYPLRADGMLYARRTGDVKGSGGRGGGKEDAAGSGRCGPSVSQLLRTAHELAGKAAAAAEGKGAKGGKGSAGGAGSSGFLKTS
jgi:hypothetical protein